MRPAGPQRRSRQGLWRRQGPQRGGGGGGGWAGWAGGGAPAAAGLAGDAPATATMVGRRWLAKATEDGGCPEPEGMAGGENC
jgi:hypothetical protein